MGSLRGWERPASRVTCSLYCSAILRSSSTCSRTSFSFLSFCFSDLVAACFSLHTGGGGGAKRGWAPLHLARRPDQPLPHCARFP